VSVTKAAAESTVETRPVEDLNAPPIACRHRLQDERSALTHHFRFGGHEGYLTVGMYPNGQPGEVFIRMSKEGSTISGLMESFATLLSVSLQHGVPLQVVCEKLAHTRFEPSGWTGNEKMGYAKSIMDYYRLIDIYIWHKHLITNGLYGCISEIKRLINKPQLYGCNGSSREPSFGPLTGPGGGPRLRSKRL
jgi:hypothetical protein